MLTAEDAGPLKRAGWLEVASSTNPSPKPLSLAEKDRGESFDDFFIAQELD